MSKITMAGNRTSPLRRLRSPRGNSPKNGHSNTYKILRVARYAMLVIIPLVWFSTSRLPTIPSNNNDVTRNNNNSNNSRLMNTPTSSSSLSLPYEQQEDRHMQDDTTKSRASSNDLLIKNMNNIIIEQDNVDQVATIPKPAELTMKTTKKEKIASSTSKTQIDKIQISPSLPMHQLYNSSHFPVLTNYTPSRTNPVQVHLIVGTAPFGNYIEPQSKALLEGLERSYYTRAIGVTQVDGPSIKTLRLQALNKNRPLVLMVDWSSIRRDCHLLERVMADLPRVLSHVILIDFSGSTRQTTCINIDKNIRLVKRNIVQGRHYDHKSKWVDPGHIMTNDFTTLDGPVLHAPIPLRQLFVAAVQNISKITNVWEHKKSTDVSFFWYESGNSNYGNLRQQVSNVIGELDKKAYIDMAFSNPFGMEQGNVQEDYVAQLLSSKIVVLAQRDEWEDHYRLMESLASGALVFTDPMLTLPNGLQNGTNLVIYDSKDSLKSLIQYYLDHKEKRLEMAKRGWEVAMGYHRTWHFVEQILFGNPLTRVQRPKEDAPVRDNRHVQGQIETNLFSSNE